MAATKRKSEAELSAIVSREIALCRPASNSRRDKQVRALEYMQGVMKDLPAEEKRSSAVSRDTADTVGWILPGIMRVFTASEHMAVAEPVGPEDSAWADQATDGINYVFWKDNDGYRVVYNATWDSLTAANGIVKTWREKVTEYKDSFHSGLTEDQVALLDREPDVEILEHTASDEVIEGPDGSVTPITVHEVRIRRKTTKGRTRIESIPPEDYGIDDDARTTDEARFQYHRVRKTRSELISEGYDRKKVESLAAMTVDSAEQLAREDEHVSVGDDASETSTQLIEVYECYAKIDIDDDGVAEFCRIVYAGSEGGGEILDWEEWEDENPFDDIPCNPMPHRWEAVSIADEVMDVQRVKTALLRSALDNTYATNNPQRFVIGNVTNPEELFTPTFGGAIFGEQGSSVLPLQVPFVANHSYDALNYQDQVVERRTGVSRQTMALDPDALQNQTATAVQNSRDAAYSQIELIARNQAELGWKKVFRKILRMEIRHQDTPRTIRMRGKPVQVDPRHWNADMDISINVGLGTGSRDRDLQFLQVIKADQIGLAERLAGAGMPEKALEMLPFIMTTLTKSAEAAGVKSPELFFPPIGQEQVEQAQKAMAERQQQGDPKIALEKEKAQADIQIAQARLQAEGGAKAQELALKREQIAAEMQLKREQLAAEMQLKRDLAFAEMEMNRQMGMTSAFGRMSTSPVRVGGDPG